MADAPIDRQGLPAGYPYRDDYEVTPRTLRDDRDRYLIIDVREADELRVASIPGVVHIPLGQLMERLDDIEPEPGQTVATLCHHGRRSLRASLALREVGFPDALSIAGGIDLWSRDIDTTVPRY